MAHIYILWHQCWSLWVSCSLIEIFLNTSANMNRTRKEIIRLTFLISDFLSYSVLLPKTSKEEQPVLTVEMVRD